MTKTTPKAAFYDIETGETVVRDMTSEEIAIHEADMADFAAQDAARVAKESARNAALTKLGLTAEEIAALS
jgi:hypothetical protein